MLTVSSNGISQASASGSNVFMGNVGIGTNNPTEKLHVAGNIRVDGTTVVSAVQLGDETRSSWSNVTAGLLTSSNNLADVDASVARTNLGLGSAATNDASAFDPAGAADSAAGVVSNALTTHTADVSNPHQVTAAQVGALSTNGGTANGTISVLSVGGDIPMGSYTNQ